MPADQLPLREPHPAQQVSPGRQLPPQPQPDLGVRPSATQVTPRHYYNKSDLTLMISWLKLPMKVQQNCRNVTKLLFLFAYTACRSQSVT